MKTERELVGLRVPGLQSRLELYIHGAEDLHVSRQVREEGIWEPYETSLLLQFLKPGHVFVDVGANIGYFSLLAASLVGEQGAVFAFEPDPLNFALLLASAEHNQLAPIIQGQQAGLAAADGEARLYLSASNYGDHQIFASGTGRDSTPIRLLQGAAYLTPQIARLDLLKVDTQGSEYGVIEGLMPLLETLARPPRIIIELTPLSLRQCGSSGRALIELLAQLGQPMWIIDHIEHRLVASSATELAQWCDNVDTVPEDEGFMNIMVGPGLH